MPRCGCHGKPARYSSGLSLRKSSKSRNGSKSMVLPNPNARRRWTPAPSIVGFDWLTRLMALMDILRLLRVRRLEMVLRPPIQGTFSTPSQRGGRSGGDGETVQTTRSNGETELTEQDPKGTLRRWAAGLRPAPGIE